MNHCPCSVQMLKLAVLSHWPLLPLSFISQAPWDIVPEVHSHVIRESQHLSTPLDLTPKWAHSAGLSYEACLRHFHTDLPSVFLLCWFWLLSLWPEYCLVSETMHQTSIENFSRSWPGTLWLVNVLPPVWALEAASSLSAPAASLPESWSRARLSYDAVWERYRPFRRMEPSSISEIDFLPPHFFSTQPTIVLSLPKLQLKAEYTLNRPEYAFCFPLVDYASFSSHFKKLMKSLMLTTRCKAVHSIQARVRCPVKFVFGSVNLLVVRFCTTWSQRVKDISNINASPHLSNFAASACQMTVEKLLWKEIWRTLTKKQNLILK